MGIALILLGLVAAGLVVDFAVENWDAGAADLSFSLVGGSFVLTPMQVVLSAALFGAVAVATVAIGAGLFRGSRGRRRTARRRIADLERENAALRQRQAEPHGARRADERPEVVGSAS